MNKHDLRAAIIAHIAANPDDHAMMSAAVTAGVQIAMANLNDARAAADMAMMSALILADSKQRVADDLRPALLEKIGAAIRTDNASPLEKKFLALNGRPIEIDEAKTDG